MVRRALLLGLCLPALAGLACGDGEAPLEGAGDAGDVTSPDAGAPSDSGLSDAGTEPDAGATAAPDQVETGSGLVIGRAEAGVWSFLGIPYAAPPVGEARFARPGAHPGWDAPREALAYGPVCPQRSRGAIVGDEDCLTLNVWTARAEAPKPVMVWIHGGAYIQGAGSVPLYDGARLVADGDVVVVSINYRLGALGFLALDGVPANLGLLDQVAALDWVRDNIAAFGGDPARVTVFGESAGGGSVCALLGMSAAAGRFHRAAIQSGGGCLSFAPGDRARDVGASLAAQVGCDAAADVKACLQELDATTLTEAIFALSTSALGLPALGPTIDGEVLTEQPYATFARGGGNEVPILIGSNADEAVTFTTGIQIRTRAALEQRIGGLVGAARAADVAALYPEADFPQPKAAFDTFMSDVGFNCPAESFARVAAGGPSPVFFYHFTHRLDGAAGSQGSLHGHEIPFVFGNVDISPQYTPTEDDRTLATGMLDAWARFAWDGAPRTMPAWPAYDPAAPSVMTLDVPLAVTETFRDGRCEALRGLRLLP